MPKRIDNMERTPAGRISRRVVPKLPVQDRKGITARAYSATLAELELVEDRLDRLYTSATMADEAAAELKTARHQRNRHVVDLWFNHRARGLNLRQAAGVVNTVFYRAKLDLLDVKSIPHLPDTDILDRERVAQLLLDAGIEYDPDAPAKMAALVHRIAVLSGRQKAALLVRNWIGVDLVEEGYTRVSVSAMMGREGWQVVREDLKVTIPDALRKGPSVGAAIPNYIPAARASSELVSA